MNNNTLFYEDIKQYLTTEFIGRKLIYLEKTASTNDYIKEFINDRKNNGLTVIAEDQTNGRGRMGRHWASQKGKAITMSVLLMPGIDAGLASYFTSISAVSLNQAIINTINVESKIKWPNDIVLNNKKISGILVESGILHGKANFLIIGMGVNVNQEYFDEEIAETASSLKICTGCEIDRKILVSNILNAMESNYNIFINKGMGPFLDYLKKNSAVLNKDIIISLSKEKLYGRAIDIDKEGHLIVKLNNGETKIVSGGEVTIRGLKSYIPG